MLCVGVCLCTFVGFSVGVHLYTYACNVYQSACVPVRLHCVCDVCVCVRASVRSLAIEFRASLVFPRWGCSFYLPDTMVFQLYCRFSLLCQGKRDVV